MQNVIVEKPYEFVPPSDSNFWPSLVQRFLLRRTLKNSYGVETIEERHVERLRASVEAGHGILLAPNHCRLSDPMSLGPLARKVGTHLYLMASWHLFNQDWVTNFMVRRVGAFSVYREGLDRKALSTAIQLLADAKRPLVVFPEGAISRHNDQLMAMLDGISFIARSAAKRRAKTGGSVVVHPVAIRYFFEGDLKSSIRPILTKLEERFSWQPRINAPILDRIKSIAEAFLALKEIEYFRHTRQGDPYDRVAALIDEVLAPLEEEWGIAEPSHITNARVKNLRSAILPAMVNGELSEEERERRWHQLAACYYVLQLSHYPRDYVSPEVLMPDRILETVERLEEDLTDSLTKHGPFRAVLDVGEAIAVKTTKPPRGEEDPVTAQIELSLRDMLKNLAREAKVVTSDELR